MATHVLEIPLGSSNVVFFEPAAISLQANDLNPQDVAVFKDTTTRDTLGFSFIVPQNYVGTPKIGLIWATTATIGNARLEADVTPVADGESADPAANTESVGATVAAPGTARLQKYTELAFTGSTFAAGDRVQGVIARDGAEAGPLDTIAASVYLLSAYFKYADA
jgi:hypothetical protein